MLEAFAPYCPVENGSIPIKALGDACFLNNAVLECLLAFELRWTEQ